MQDPNLTSEILKSYLHYDPETGAFKWKESRGRVEKNQLAGSISCGRVLIRLCGCVYKAHRLAWLYMTGEWPNGQIDHRDGNQMNNAWGNIREVSATVNQQNKRKAYSNSKTGLLGASLDKKTSKYVARIKLSDKRVTIGYFNTAQEAHEAYVEAKRKLHEGNTI